MFSPGPLHVGRRDDWDEDEPTMSPWWELALVVIPAAVTAVGGVVAVWVESRHRLKAVELSIETVDDETDEPTGQADGDG